MELQGDSTICGRSENSTAGAHKAQRVHVLYESIHIKIYIFMYIYIYMHINMHTYLHVFAGQESIHT